MTSTETNYVLGRISDVDVVIEINGKIVVITLTFEREDGWLQAANFKYDSHFKNFMGSCAAVTTENLKNVVCKLFLSNDITMVITKIRTVFGQPAEISVC